MPGMPQPISGFCRCLFQAWPLPWHLVGTCNLKGFRVEARRALDLVQFVSFLDSKEGWLPNKTHPTVCSFANPFSKFWMHFCPFALSHVQAWCLEPFQACVLHRVFELQIACFCFFQKLNASRGRHLVSFVQAFQSFT